IIVPGFLGSSLHDPSTWVGPSEIWLNPVRLAAGGFNRMRLAVPGEPAPPPAGAALEGGTPISAYYSLLAGYLVFRGWDVNFVTADFRQAMSHDAAILAAKIRTLSATAPVQIIAHSRGGLVARTAIAQLAAAGLTGLVSRVITLGTPHTGSLEAVATIACFGGTKLKLERLNDAIPQWLGSWLGTGEVRSTLRSWPALYELLPAPSASWLTAQTVAQLYLPATYSNDTFVPVPQYLADALAAWNNLPPMASGIDWIDVAGIGLGTYDGVDASAGVSDPSVFSTSLDGDATVPFKSAHPGGNRLVSVPCNHDLLPQDGRLWPVLHQALTAGLPADVVIGGAVLTI
ncbi:MAG TPA: hypothetical protein VH092_38395, partial [Urbifossiella sp.]|nr:hypothetical protein [Urbifossiella sp.]